MNDKDGERREVWTLIFSDFPTLILRLLQPGPQGINVAAGLSRVGSSRRVQVCMEMVPTKGV